MVSLDGNKMRETNRFLIDHGLLVIFL